MINRITRQTVRMCGRCVAILTLYNSEISHYVPSEQSWEVCLNDLIYYHVQFMELDNIVQKIWIKPFEKLYTIPAIWKKISATVLSFWKIWNMRILTKTNLNPEKGKQEFWKTKYFLLVLFFQWLLKECQNLEGKVKILRKKKVQKSK